MSTDEQKQAAEAQTQETEAAEGSLLDSILSDGMRARDEQTREWGKDLLKEFVEQLLGGSTEIECIFYQKKQYYPQGNEGYISHPGDSNLIQA